MADRVVLQAGRCTHCGEGGARGGRIFHIAGCPFEIPGMATQLLGGSPSQQLPIVGWEQPTLPIPTMPRISPHGLGPRVATDIPAIAARYLAGETIRAIAESLHVSYQTVRNRLLQAKVQFRPRQPPAEPRTRDPIGRRVWRPTGSCSECGQPRAGNGRVEHAAGCRYVRHSERGRLYGALRAS